MKNNNHCIDCGKETKGQGLRCYSCCKKGKNSPLFNTHRTKEVKNKISKKMSGKNHPNYGKHLSKQTKQKLRKSNLGKKKPDVSKRMKGENNPMFGDHRFAGKNHPMFGKKSPKHSKRMRGRNNPMYGKMPTNKDKNYRNGYYKDIWMRSSYEIAYAKYLDENNIKWFYESKTFGLGNTTYTPDFYLPKSNTYIEIKGWWRDNAKKKFKIFKKQYPKIKIDVLNRQKLKLLKVIK